MRVAERSGWRVALNLQIAEKGAAEIGRTQHFDVTTEETYLLLWVGDHEHQHELGVDRPVLTSQFTEGGGLMA